MRSCSMRRRSYRELGRLQAVDQNGVSHVLIERVETINQVGCSGHVVDTERGASNFYSATNGDAVTRLADGSFRNHDGTLRLWLTE